LRPGRTGTASLVAAPKRHTYGEGGTIAFRVTFTEPVVATGIPTLPISIGDTVRQAAWNGRRSGSRSLTFTLGVQSGDFAPAGVRVAGPIVLPDGAAIRDRAGNDLNPAASGEFPRARVDAIGPSVSDFGHIAIAGKGVSMRVTFTAPVTLRGKPSISFMVDGAPRQLVYARGSGSVSPENSFGSTTSIVGLATEFGEIRMRFTPTSGGSPVIGVGQFREVNGTNAIQMQMISGQAGEAYTTHWASMLPYDPGSFTPPDPRPDTDLTSTEWAWTPGTTWEYQSDELFGPGGVGSFTITNYRNGYFWGSGSGPAGTLGESFTQLGSITPEGNVLFNVLTGQSVPTLLTLTGQITGEPLTARMALRTYEFSGSDPAFGAVGYAVIVPEPTT
jgi:hypothetical protein